MTPQLTDTEQDILIDLTELQERTDENESVDHLMEWERLEAAAAYLIRH